LRKEIKKERIALFFVWSQIIWPLEIASLFRNDVTMIFHCGHTQDSNKKRRILTGIYFLFLDLFPLDTGDKNHLKFLNRDQNTTDCFGEHEIGNSF